MATFQVNLSKLSELQTDLNNNKQKFSALNDRFFTKLQKVKTMWHDPNTEPFLKKAAQDKDKIDEYNKNVKKVNDTILNFITNLTSIARTCGASSHGTFSYNGSRAKSVKANCQTAYSYATNAKNKLDYINIPTSYRYAYQLRNMKYKINDINEQIKRITNDLSSVINSIEGTFNTIQNASKIDTIHLRPMELSSNIISSTLTSSSEIVENAKAKENQLAQKAAVDYKETTSNYQNNSQNQVYGGKRNEFEESDSNFVNSANRTTTRDNMVLFEEQNSNYQNNSQNQVYGGKQNAFEENGSNFVNSSTNVNTTTNNVDFNQNESTFNAGISKTSAQTQTNQFQNNSNFNYSNSEKSVDVTSNQVQFTNTNTNINTPDEVKVNNTNINTNVNNNMPNIDKRVNANNATVEFNNTTVE